MFPTDTDPAVWKTVPEFPGLNLICRTDDVDNVYLAACSLLTNKGQYDHYFN